MDEKQEKSNEKKVHEAEGIKKIENNEIKETGKQVETPKGLPSVNEDLNTEGKQIKEQNKILKKMFIGIGTFILIIVLVVLFFNSVRHFEYKGVGFNIVKEGEIIFYNAVFPMYAPMTGKHIADYNFYIRNDPRKLEDIAFDGELVLLKNMVINSTEDFNCDGDGMIAVANLINFCEFAGIEVITDENAGCDSQGKYMFVQIQPGNVTGIEQTGPACYNLNINDCEILKVTERFMVEGFVDINN